MKITNYFNFKQELLIIRSPESTFWEKAGQVTLIALKALSYLTIIIPIFCWLRGLYAQEKPPIIVREQYNPNHLPIDLPRVVIEQIPVLIPPRAHHPSVVIEQIAAYILPLADHPSVVIEQIPVLIPPRAHHPSVVIEQIAAYILPLADHPSVVIEQIPVLIPPRAHHPSVVIEQIAAHILPLADHPSVVIEQIPVLTPPLADHPSVVIEQIAADIPPEEKQLPIAEGRVDSTFRESVIQKISKGALNFSQLSAEQKKDKLIVIAAIEKDVTVSNEMDEAFLSDMDVMLAIANKSIGYLRGPLASDREFWLKLVEIDYLKLGFLKSLNSENLEEDENFMVKATRINHNAWKYSSEKLKNKKIFLLAIIKQHFFIYDDLSGKYKKDVDFFIKALKANPKVIRFLGNSYRSGSRRPFS